MTNHPIKILVVEDEMIIAEDIAGRLKKFGYTVTGIVTSGEEAIAHIAETKPDLILMDIVLEGEIDGIAAAEKIRNDSPIPVVFLTAYADEKTLQKAKLTQPFGYILKPFKDKDLYATIEIAIQRHEVEKKMRLMVEALEASSTNNEYVSMVVHELSNPLTAIIAASKLMEVNLSNLDEAKKIKYLQLIHSNSQRMNRIIENMLLIGKATEDGLQFNPELINLSSLCGSLVEEVELGTGGKAQILFICDREIVAMVDPNLLKHILLNLLSNAIKYSPQGWKVIFQVEFGSRQEAGKLENVTLTGSTNTNSSDIVFHIQDKGIGIPKADQDNLFTPFYRCQNVGKIAGNGLGLAMVKKAVELHGGTITIESELGVGTIFTVRIPALSEQIIDSKIAPLTPQSWGNRLSLSPPKVGGQGGQA